MLDYRGNREHGLHVIAIGGLALSRGLTLEGQSLIFFVILRPPTRSCRWRAGSATGRTSKICRVYLPQIALDHYEEINEAIEELRTEVRRMQDVGMTPEHFGLKVRESPTAIKITAANKMRSATQMTVAQDYSERHLEGYILPNDQRQNLANLEEVKRFMDDLARLRARSRPTRPWSGGVLRATE